MAKRLYTKAELLAPIAATCAKCGGQATIYCYPLPQGSLFCPVCSPAWLGSFLEFVSKAEVKALA